MSKTFRGNLFFLIVLITLISGSVFFLIPLKIFNLPNYYAIFLPEILFLFIPALIYLAVTKRPVKSTLRLNSLGLYNSIIVIAVILFCWPVTVIIGIVTQIFFNDNVSTALNLISGLGFFSKLMIIALTPAVCEEIVFRGVILGEYKRINIKTAAVANGFLFGLFHLNPFQFFYTFFVGIILAYLVYITNSFFAGVLGHFTFNGMQVVISQFFSSSSGTQSTSSVNLTFGVLSSYVIIAAVVIIICISAIIKLINLLKIININKAYINEYDFERSGSLLNEDIGSQKLHSDDTVLNWPFFAAIAVYMLFIILEQAYYLLK